MKKANALVSLLVVVLIGLLGFGALYYFLSPKEPNVITEPTPTPAPTGEVEDTVVPTEVEEEEVTITPTVISGTPIVEATPPANWEKISNLNFLPYEVWRPNGFYYRYFSPSTLGFDPAPLPEASEYAGMLSITQLQSGMSWTNDYVNELMAGYTTTTLTIKGNNWTVLEGKTKANEIFDSQFVKLGYVQVGGKEYVVKLVSSDANYGGHESKFDIMISILIFK